MSDVTQVLDRAQQGGPKPAEELLPLGYDELRRLAVTKMAQQAAGQTLQATALVHEAWLRIEGGAARHWESRKHFFAAAAQAMRYILIERARRKLRARHGAELERVDLDAIEIAAPTDDDERLRVRDARAVDVRGRHTLLLAQRLDLRRRAVDDDDADVQAAQHRDVEQDVGEVLSTTMAPSMARTKVFSRKRGMYCRMPRKSVGFISRNQRAARDAGEVTANGWPCCTELPAAAALGRFDTTKEVFSSAKHSMQFSRQR